MNHIAIIPARGGSKGIPKKNILSIAGYPLLAYSIVAAFQSQKIGRIVVSTDSEEIASVARAFGAEVPFLRPTAHAQDTSTDRDVLLHAMHWYEKNEKHIPEYWVHLRPTTPLRDPKIIDNAIKEIVDHPEATSLRSGHPVAESPFKWFSRDEKGYFKGILPNDPRPEYYNLPRQAFPAIYIPDGYVDIVKTSFALQSESLNGHKMMGFITPVCYEIDTWAEVEWIEFQLAKHGHPLLNYLTENFPQQ